MALSTKLPVPLMQTQWASEINPLLANPSNNSRVITGIVLVANTPQVVNHKLGRKMQGWEIADINANANVWRTQPFNAQTITLESSANVTINIRVF
jgi:hypothetical protein